MQMLLLLFCKPLLSREVVLLVVFLSLFFCFFPQKPTKKKNKSSFDIYTVPSTLPVHIIYITPIIISIYIDILLCTAPLGLAKRGNCEGGTFILEAMNDTVYIILPFVCAFFCTNSLLFSFGSRSRIRGGGGRGRMTK